MSGPAGRDAVLRARDLAAFFDADPAAFGRFDEVPAARLPAGPRRLLDHASHMTVAMEQFHGGPVGLRVVRRREDAAGRYAREILLTGPDGRVVQHGIVRIDLGRLAPAVAEAIRAEATPLGRILLTAGLLGEVHDVNLLEILPGPHLESLFERATAATGPTFGRVATIDLDGSPAIELLEIVAPGTAG
jgi:hypothetical protein